MRNRAVSRIVALTSGLVLATTSGAAHVDYVTDEETTGSVGELFQAVFSSPLNVALLVAGTVGVVALVAGYLRFASLVPDIEVTRKTLQSYRPYLPWMLRLSVGLPLVGAGFAGYLFSPSVPADGRILQVGIGFLLLFGLATRVVAAFGLVVYFVSLPQHFPDLLLASEYVAGFLAIIAVGAGQPSADMLIQRLLVTEGTLASRFRGVVPTPTEMVNYAHIEETVAPIALRIFLGINFLYLGVSQKLLEPQQAMAVVAKYDLTAVVPVSPEMWVFGAGMVEAAVGVAFLAGAFTRGTATVGFIMLTTTLFGLPDDPVLAHITLFGLTSALMVTGAGQYSLDSSVIPRLRSRFGTTEEPSGQPTAD